MGKRQVALTFVLVTSIILLSSGMIDIDWQVTTYYYHGGNSGIWWFTPSLQMGWYEAYFISILRIIIGAAMLGFYIAIYLKEN